MYILSVDQGTTSTRAILFDRTGGLVAQSQIPHKQILSTEGHVSHDAEEIFENVVTVCKSALINAGTDISQVAAIGLTNQRETLVAWDKETGKPICPAIVWQCRRTADICKQMKDDGMETPVRNKTGLVVDPYFSATKIKWIKDHYPDKPFLAGTIDSYLIYRLTGGKMHVTDYTNASRTMLFNINTLRWDDELLKYFDIDENILPQVVPSSGIIAHTHKDIFGISVPISGVAGDQHAALFGQTCFLPGDMKNTFGTGCFILKNIGSQPIISENRLLTTIAWHIGGKTTYALEGSIMSAGAAVEWLVRELQIVADVHELNDICNNTPSTAGVYFVPAFTGLGAPYWDMYARGTICGMMLSTNRHHIVRAVMEAIAFQSRDVIETMDRDTDVGITKLRVDGGISRSAFAMQFQSDILNIPVERPRITETTALGAAYLAGLGVGFYESTDAIIKQREIDAVYNPAMSREQSDLCYKNWLKAVERARGWANE